MNVSEFIKLLEHPEKTSEQELFALKKIIKEYSYFQSARALYLKALKQQDHFEYNTVLKHTAAHTTDRSVLFDFITSTLFLQHKTSDSISKEIVNVNAINVNAEEFIVEIFDKKETENILNPELFHPKIDEAKTEKTAPDEELPLRKSLTFNADEMHSFSEWLKITSLKPIDREISQTETSKRNSQKEEKFKRIDKFIAQNPKIIPQKGNTTINLAKEKTFEKSELMTETLAKVYVAQKKFKKAIQAYTILSLKYPEKSGFFADQIKAIKKLQQNNT
jgi:hypothetical protein